MNPTLAGLLIVGCVFAFFALMFWLATREPSTRRAELARVERERVLAALALAAIRTETDKFSDLDSVLATAIRRHLNDYETKRLEIR